jgi:hypothetical protein
MPDFKLYYRVIEIKTAQYCHKRRYEGQWNRTKDVDVNPCSYAHHSTFNLNEVNFLRFYL